MPLNFDLTLVAERVTLSGGDYLLVELTGTQRDAHMNDVNGRVKNSRITDFNNIQATLVAKSLRRIVAAGTEKSVPIAVTVLGEEDQGPQDFHVVAVGLPAIAAYPSRVQKALNDRVKGLSGMEDDEDDEDEEKNE